MRIVPKTPHDKCPCGADKFPVRSGCDDCERGAYLALDAKRPHTSVPHKWWRRFEPEWSCGAYYLYGRADLSGDVIGRAGFAKSQLELVTACTGGVSIENSWELDHMDRANSEALARVIVIAAADAAFLRQAQRVLPLRVLDFARSARA